MRTFSVQVEVELGEIDTDDLLNELVDRLKTPNDMYRREYEKIFGMLSNHLGYTTIKVSEITLDDRLKIEQIVKVFPKYSSQDLCKLIP